MEDEKHKPENDHKEHGEKHEGHPVDPGPTSASTPPEGPPGLDGN